MPWRHMGDWRYSSTILNLGNRWRWVVSFTPWPLYLRHPLDRRLGGPQRWSGCCGEEKNLVMPGIEPGQSIPLSVAIPIPKRESTTKYIFSKRAGYVPILMFKHMQKVKKHRWYSTFLIIYAWYYWRKISQKWRFIFWVMTGPANVHSETLVPTAQCIFQFVHLMTL
jgi:hypothetical protein